MALRAVETQEPHADARGSLHVAGLRDEHVGLRAVLGLRPARAAAVARRTSEQVRGHARREVEVPLLVRHAVQIEEELRDTRVAAALADVVPEAGRALLGDAAIECAAGGLCDPRHPGPIAGRDGELIEETRRAGRTVTPAEIVEV